MNKNTTITLSRETLKELVAIKYDNGFGSIEETIKYLMGKKNK